MILMCQDKTLRRVERIISRVANRHPFHEYRTGKALITAPFGQEHYDGCVARLTESRAVSGLATRGEIDVFLITSSGTKTTGLPGWITLIQSKGIPGWPGSDIYGSRFFKWSIPFLFTNVRCSLYIDSDFIITQKAEKLARLFSITEEHDFFVTGHVKRKGWQDEYDAIRERKNLKTRRIQRQKRMFERAGVPREGPVFETGFVGRVHGSRYDTLSREVLCQLFAYSERDQLALIYAVFKHGLMPFSVPEGDVLFASHVQKVNPDTLCFVDHYHRRMFTSIYDGPF
jgi:hypothetical protein